MNCFCRALVPSAVVCIAMFLQGCAPVAEVTELTGDSHDIMITSQCDSKIDMYMVVEKNKSLISITEACATIAADNMGLTRQTLCLEHGSLLTDEAYKVIKEDATVTCTKFVLDLEKLKNATAVNASEVPGAVDEWVSANKEERVKFLVEVNTFIITEAKTPDLDIAAATERVLVYCGEDSKTSEAVVVEEQEDVSVVVEDAEAAEASPTSAPVVAISAAAEAEAEAAAAPAVAAATETEAASETEAATETEAAPATPEATTATETTATSATEPAPEATGAEPAETAVAPIGAFAMSGGNKIQAISTSHAGRWVASACSLLMVMAGVFRFSRRAWLTPSPTESETHGLVNGEVVDGEREHSAA